MNNNNLFKINQIKKISFSDNNKITTYSEKTFKNINFSKYILNIKLNKVRDVENIILGFFININKKPINKYPWFTNINFIQDKICWYLINMIYLKMFKYTKEPPILVYNHIFKHKSFNQSKYLLNPIKRWKYGSNFSNIQININNKNGDKTLFYTLSNIEFKRIVIKKKFFLLNYDILYYWYLSTNSYEKNNIIFLNYSFDVIGLKIKLRYLNFFNLEHNKNYILFKGKNYIIFKRILNKFYKLK